MDGMDYDIMLAANGTITPGYSSGDEDAEEKGATNEIIMGTACQFSGDQAAVEFGVDNSNGHELGEEEPDPGEYDSEKIDAGMFDACDSNASDSDAIEDNAATGLHTIVQDGEAALVGPVFYIPGASKLSPINIASDDDKMSTQEAQAVFDKVDEVQMKFDEALDILEELKRDGNTLFLKQKYPRMKLMETITAVQAILTALTNGEMEFMTNELQNVGAKFNLDDAPAIAVSPAATTNKRPATVSTSPAPGNAANANKRPAIAAGPSSPAIFSSPRVPRAASAGPRAPPAYIPPPPGHVVANIGTFRGHPAQLPMFKEDLKAEDRLMIQMKTGKKHSWDQITDAYIAMVGKEINQSTLTSRWGKMKKSYGEDALIAWGEELREAEYMRQAL